MAPVGWFRRDAGGDGGGDGGADDGGESDGDGRGELGTGAAGAAGAYLRGIKCFVLEIDVRSRVMGTVAALSTVIFVTTAKSPPLRGIGEDVVRAAVAGETTATEGGPARRCNRAPEGVAW